MKRALLVLLAAFGLLVGGHVAPAAAHPMYPGQVSQDNFYSCNMWATYGTYGTGFAQIQMLHGTACNGSGAVSVTTAFGQGTEKTWCNFAQAIYVPTSQCYMTQNSLAITFMVVGPGPAIRMSDYGCVDSLGCLGPVEHWWPL